MSAVSKSKAQVLAVVLAIATTSAGARADSPEDADAVKTRLLVTDLEASGVDQRVTKVVTSLIAVEIARQTTFSVVSGADLRQMLELEAARQSSGCTNDASCFAEIAGALGARRVVFGSVSHLGTEFVVTLTLLNSDTVSALGRVTSRVSNEGKLADEVPKMVRVLMSSSELRLEEVEKASTSALLPWSVLGAGATLSVVGVAAMVVGAIPLWSYVVATNELDALAQNATIDDLETATELHKSQTEAANLWSPGGGIAVLGGATAATIGIGLSIVGAFLLSAPVDGEASE